MRCAHRSVLVVVHAACLCCCWLLFFLCPDFPFSEGHLILENKQNAYELHPPNYDVCTACDTCVACLKKNEGARDSLYSTGLLPSSHSVVDASARHAAMRGLPLRSVFSDQNFKTQQQRPPPCVFFCCGATLSNRSVSP